ncbi:hypothetical protein E4U27_000474 [Claviceps purpurea]|nr:hypothetical protein E4U28_005295 [Claviceps purpurea]KAG6170560.1 hypothetical protein E4U51_000746 [Claviceps purpurea]KAG6185555.1 hypothetical protein E4U27_000474 [Claviceps purpurea]
MLRHISRTRSLRPTVFLQRRLYSPGPNEPAEFSANKSSANMTKFIAAGVTAVALGAYSFMAGNPRQAAKVDIKTSPEAAIESVPSKEGQGGVPR